MKIKAKWIRPNEDFGEVVPLYKKCFSIKKDIKKAILYITAMGVYEANINQTRVGDFLLAPGWTSYKTRLQYQSYDVANLLKSNNTITVEVAKGWYDSLKSWETVRGLRENPPGLIAQLDITYTDDTTESICSDNDWCVLESKTRFSDIYDGEVYDATFEPSGCEKAVEFDGPTKTLIAQQGEKICAHERIDAANIFITPLGETVIDFGQNLTGFVEINLNANKGDIVDLSFAEVLDKEGNFYNANYRSAKCQYTYTCTSGKQTWHPKFTFYGFRYIRVNKFPAGVENAAANNFTAVVVHSNIERTGYVHSSDHMLNRLFENCLWGQKDNFLDVPTDCPQRDERLGWTGDAQVFAKTAALQFNVEKFFNKWLSDVAAEQDSKGCIPHVVPDVLYRDYASTAWGDVATILPWEMYLAYGNKKMLKKFFPMMKKWISYITSVTTTKYLWTGGNHYGDWLGLDAPSGSYRGSSNDNLIATAFYAHSTNLVIKAGKVLGEDTSYYEQLYKNIVTAFRENFPKYNTQTEYVLAIHFNLAEDPQKSADELANLIKSVGTKLQTGFVGTPYLLYALSEYGHTELAYELLFRKEYPSWLYPITMGATTIWEHWDSTMPDGSFWSTDMNSYNHYAYGSVLGWVYNQAAGINVLEEGAGYTKIRIAPKPTSKLDWLNVSLKTKTGVVVSNWHKKDGYMCYEIKTPVNSEIIIDGNTHIVAAGEYVFYSKL